MTSQSQVLTTTANVAVIGLGYVGLPLAVAFAKSRYVLGFDTNQVRLEELKIGVDRTGEVSQSELTAVASSLEFTGVEESLRAADIFIVTVPTPIDRFKRPDLQHLTLASELVGRVMNKGALVIYESTVFPGCTEEHCVPLLSAQSGLIYNQDFFCGYSPERINPGDKKRRLEDIVKVTSGSNSAVANLVDALYAEIIPVGTHKAESIRVAEAAKVIENTQRDINIALMNELSIIFGRLGIDTLKVLEAAASKWNFLPFEPGLVGGHCIGVDPYYLAHKAQEVGYYPNIIMAGRQINDGMGSYVATQLIKSLLRRGCNLDGAKILIMGFTFKENCPDTRNTRVVDIVNDLTDYGCKVMVYDPWVAAEELEAYSGVIAEPQPQDACYDAVIVSVAHEKIKEWGINAIKRLGKKDAIFFDLKGLFPADASDFRL